MERGPRGSRVHVVDYDASTGTLYQPFEYSTNTDGTIDDVFETPDKKTILTDPNFHAQNVYAIVMRLLSRFEYALGRRVEIWMRTGMEADASFVAPRGVPHWDGGFLPRMRDLTRFGINNRKAHFHCRCCEVSSNQP